MLVPGRSYARAGGCQPVRVRPGNYDFRRDDEEVAGLTKTVMNISIAMVSDAQVCLFGTA